MIIYYKPYLEGNLIIGITQDEFNKMLAEEIEILKGYGLTEKQAKEAAINIINNHIVDI